MNTPKTLGERLRMVRGKIPQELFSIPYGINQNTLSRYERNERTPDADFIASICKENSVLPSWLLLGEGPMHLGEQEEQPKQQPVAPHAAEPCQRCAKLEAKLDKVEQQRDELVAENKKLLIENGELKEKNATLRERQRKEDDSLLEKQQGSGSTDMLITPKGVPPMRARR